MGRENKFVLHIGRVFFSVDSYHFSLSLAYYSILWITLPVAVGEVNVKTVVGKVSVEGEQSCLRDCEKKKLTLQGAVD